MELGPLSTRQRPFVLKAELIGATGLQDAAGTDLQLDRRFVHDAGVDALQPVIHETQLIDAPFFGMEGVVMRTGMDAQFLVLGGGLRKSLGVAA